MKAVPEDNAEVVASAHEIWQRLSSKDDDASARRPAELIRAASAHLARAGLPSPAVDARLLLRHVTNLTSAELLISGSLDQPTAQQFQSLVMQRAAGAPIQHLTGRAPFRYVELAVGPGVFIPRPETELVAGAAIDEAKRLIALGQRVQVVELCAGSGAISRSLVDEVPGIAVTAVELSADALPYLRRNLAEYDQVDIVHADLVELPQLRPQLIGNVDIVVVNPPYVPTSQELPADVQADPALALYGGSDGLEVIRTLLPIAHELLASAGLLVIEHGDDQGERVVELLQAADFAQAEYHYDLTKRERFSTARRGKSDLSRVHGDLTEGK